LCNFIFLSSLYRLPGRTRHSWTHYARQTRRTRCIRSHSLFPLFSAWIYDTIKPPPGKELLPKLQSDPPPIHLPDIERFVSHLQIFFTARLVAVPAFWAGQLENYLPIYNPNFLQRLDHPVYGGDSDIRIFFMYLVVNFLAAGAIICQNRLNYKPALIGNPVSFVS